MEEVGVSKVSSVEDLSNEQFLEIFKISRTVFMYLYDEIKRYFKTPRSNAVTPMVRLACCLQILSKQKLNQKIIRENSSICPQLSLSQPSVSRSVEMVLNVFENKICPMWIKFPSTEMEISKCKKRFLEETGLVNVIGYVACMNISVLPFINNQERFGNSSGVQSINVQVVCDYDMRILSVDPRYPGGVPGRDIWSVSVEKDELERCYRDGRKNILLAGFDYLIEPWLITPFLLDDTSTSQEINFNRKHAMAQSRISKCLSILYNKFGVIQSARYPVEKMAKIINACCALYNISLEMGSINDDDDSNEESEYSYQLLSDENSLLDGPGCNPYYKFGSAVRDEMMRHLSE